MRDFSNYWKALTYATQIHGITLRKDRKTPYIVHPLRITAILRAAGFTENANEELMMAALFHDIVEDTNTSIEAIKNKFGKKVASIVDELTIPKSKNKEDFLKNLKHASKEAKLIKLADRIDNLMDLSIDSWSKEKKRSYAEQARIILKSCGDAHVELASILQKEIEKSLNLLLK
jgi:guanosine-3',5'-bis(diphosphate) 3'-pyrophosphohydrolase